MITPQQFRSRLLRWYDAHGRKHLPWQQEKSAYKVWISEIMLQQTQVNTVIPYFERFIQQFPDLNSLANAPLDHVLHLWAGLGYYSRARNLHRAAQIIQTNYQGIFPSDGKALIGLPGIGESTAGAILSIAFNQSATILDGNVKRVLTRLHAITEPINDKHIDQLLWATAKNYTPKQRVGDYTQAIMDLGATLCTRSKPNCDQCPFENDCLAHQQGIAISLPKKKKTPELPIRTRTFIILQKEDSFLLQKRTGKGVWHGLWSFPEIDHPPDKKNIRSFCLQQFQLPDAQYELLKPFRHTFTHYHLDIHPVKIMVKKLPKKIMDEQQQIWYNPAHPGAIGLPKPIQTILRGMHGTSGKMRKVK